MPQRAAISQLEPFYPHGLDARPRIAKWPVVHFAADFRRIFH